MIIKGVIGERKSKQRKRAHFETGTQPRKRERENCRNMKGFSVGVSNLETIGFDQATFLALAVQSLRPELGKFFRTAKNSYYKKVHKQRITNCGKDPCNSLLRELGRPFRGVSGRRLWFFNDLSLSFKCLTTIWQKSWVQTKTAAHWNSHLDMEKVRIALSSSKINKTFGLDTA